MDVKGIVRNIIPLPTSAAKEARRAVKTDSTTDREGNGQQAQGEEKPPKRDLSKEELAAVVKHLEELPGILENGLKVRLVCQNGINTVYVEDPLGKIVRRIPEAELASMPIDKEKKSGHLFDKAM